MQTAIERAQNYYQQNQTVEVSDALLNDLAYLYASEAFGDQAAADEFAEHAGDRYRLDAMRLDFCHCCMAVNSALHLVDQAEYEALLPLLELAGSEQLAADLRRYVLRKLATDAAELADDLPTFNARIDLAIRHCI
ncbi:hypothetical protein ABVE12_20850 [Xanthomonas euvesicatoria]|uniref:Uncharacterized protein n=1 Tax=Xanthomonas euvesicatoria pv. euvesicatoria TaxID=2753541 RepID=A0ABS8LGD4_XANEU|nr:hypothetical protein [Xanthomonas euvesicatoria]MCC8633415.1 hypothetical protein [Xanthomonas euvesicatoria pv. euvesicatoria]